MGRRHDKAAVRCHRSVSWGPCLRHGWKGAVYFKVDENTRKDFDAAGSHALEYHRQGKPQALKSYMEAPADVLEDDETLVQWAERAYRAAINSHH
ncbi:TfoX/Sxy family protein [Rhizobium sp. 2YAF20]|uniref:TfoX/Sxy family protein n=1 Tax=Rhizobium sp. 2YAF20 TaxID=3233027 RepID=UPI003F9BB811